MFIEYAGTFSRNMNSVIKLMKVLAFRGLFDLRFIFRKFLYLFQLHILTLLNIDF